MATRQGRHVEDSKLQQIIPMDQGIWQSSSTFYHHGNGQKKNHWSFKIHQTVLIEGALIKYIFFTLPPLKLVEEGRRRPLGAALGRQSRAAPRTSLIDGDP
jgi:hypothetical protein